MPGDIQRCLGFPILFKHSLCAIVHTKKNRHFRKTLDLDLDPFTGVADRPACRKL